MGLAHNQPRINFENFTNNPNSKCTNNAMPLPEWRPTACTIIKTNNKSRNPQPKPKRTRTRRPSPKKTIGHKTSTKHLQPNRKRKQNSPTTNPNKTNHKTLNLKQQTNPLHILIPKAKTLVSRIKGPLIR